MEETWLYHYDLGTKQQCMEWRHSGSPTPKYSEWINPLEEFWPRFFGIKTALSHSLSSKGPNYQCRVLPISAGAIEGYVEGKMPWEGHQGCLVLAWQCPCAPGTCNPEETGLPGLLMSWSPTLFSGSGPVGLPPVPWTEKSIESSPFFVQRGGHCCHRDLVGWTTFWIFFEWLAQVRAMG